MVYVHNHTLMDSSSDDDDYDNSSFIVSDSEEPLNYDQQAHVDAEMSRLQTARVGITESGLTLEYLHGLHQPRVHARILAKADAASGSEWPVSFTCALRSDKHAVFNDVVLVRHGVCTACARPRLLTKMVIFSNGAVPAYMGSICAKRAIVMHTLLHAQAACTKKLDVLPLAQLQSAEVACVDALDTVLDAADDVGEGRVYQMVQSARNVLGIQ